MNRARRTIAAAAAAAAIVAAAPAAASAIPVRDLSAKRLDTGSVFIGASVYSPPTADGCGARTLTVIYDRGTAVWRRFKQLDVCRYEAGAWTYNNLWHFARVPTGRTYTVCAVAEQRVNGRMSRHGACIVRRF